MFANDWSYSLLKVPSGRYNLKQMKFKKINLLRSLKSLTSTNNILIIFPAMYNSHVWKNNKFHPEAFISTQHTKTKTVIFFESLIYHMWHVIFVSTCTRIFFSCVIFYFRIFIQHVDHTPRTAQTTHYSPLRPHTACTTHHTPHTYTYTPHHS